VWGTGPMFRRERPQKGRQRQFHQVDVEAFGVAEPTIDVEIIEVALAYLEECGLSGEGIELVVNSVGDANCRPAYVETLRAALRPVAAQMCGDCQRRTETNPLRVLDCKVPADQPIIDALPRISDHLCDPCRDHFAQVRAGLEALGRRYTVSHRLVRGLDYYTRTTFEVTSGALGAQNSVLGGGRYDGMVKELGGPQLPAIGFALGMERLVMALPAAAAGPRCDVLVAVPTRRAEGAAGARPGLERALLLERALRGAGLRVMLEHEGRSFKSTMKLADRLGARYVALLGEDELARGVWTIRDMTASAQEAVREDLVTSYLEGRIRG